MLHYRASGITIPIRNNLKVIFKKNSNFAKTYNNYYSVIFGTVLTRVGHLQDTEDICQEIFASYYRKLEEISNERTWLFGALRLEVLSYFRKKYNENAGINGIFTDINLTFVNGSRDIRIIINEATENMNNFKDIRDKILFDLIAIQNYTYEEAGKQIGINKRQTRYRYEHIIQRIINYLKTRGINSLEDLL